MQIPSTCSIVLYNSNFDLILDIINKFLSEKNIFKIFLIDNSPHNTLQSLAIDGRVAYIYNPSNPGFGAAHNMAIQKAIVQGSKYHFVVNPDIYFKEDVIAPMLNFIDKDKSIGMIMPQILNADGTVQNLPKLLPSPLNILLRKLKKPNFIYQPFIKKYELRFVLQNQIYEAPILSGCFTLLNLAAIQKIGMYDDHYFMYFEDWDLSRRMNQFFKTIYFPVVSVYHGYESGANKNPRLFKIFVNSAITYFNKWGWFFDANRKKINKKTLAQFS